MFFWNKKKPVTIIEQNPGPLWKEKLKDTQVIIEHPKDTPGELPPKSLVPPSRPDPYIAK